MNRRNFLKTILATGAALTVPWRKQAGNPLGSVPKLPATDMIRNIQPHEVPLLSQLGKQAWRPGERIVWIEYELTPRIFTPYFEETGEIVWAHDYKLTEPEA